MFYWLGTNSIRDTHSVLAGSTTSFSNIWSNSCFSNFGAPGPAAYCLDRAIFHPTKQFKLQALLPWFEVVVCPKCVESFAHVEKPLTRYAMQSCNSRILLPQSFSSNKWPSASCACLSGWFLSILVVCDIHCAEIVNISGLREILASLPFPVSSYHYLLALRRRVPYH